MKTFLAAVLGVALAFAAPAAAVSQTCGNIDIFWVIDESGSVGSTNHQLMVNAVAATADTLVLGPNDNRMSVIEYNSNVPGEEFLWHTLTADTAANKATFQSVVSGMSFSGGSTNTAGALQYALNYLQSSNGAARPDTAQIVVLLTDGMENVGGNSDPVVQALQAAGIIVIFVPIGAGINSNRYDGIIPDQYVFASPDFQQLDTVITNIISEIECFTPGPDCIADTEWDLANQDLVVEGNSVTNPFDDWKNAAELDSSVGSPPCCIRFGVSIHENHKGNAAVGLMQTVEGGIPLSGFLGQVNGFYGADTKDDFFAFGGPTTSFNSDQEGTGQHTDKERDYIEVTYCPGDATITVITYQNGVPKSFRTFNNVPAGDYKLVTSLKNDAGAGPNFTTKVTIVLAECFNCDFEEVCVPEWDCRTGGMAIYDSVPAGPISVRDGLEFTKRGWAKVWRNGVSITRVVHPGEIIEVVFTLDFLISKSDFMVGLNPACDKATVEQAVNSPDSIMYWGAGWLYIGGAQHTRIDWQNFYPRQGDEVKVKVDLIAGTVQFELNAISNGLGLGFQPMHAPINIPIRSYYAAGSIKYVNAKIGLRCPDQD